MPRSIQVASTGFAIAMISLALGFGLRMSWATRLWPWSDGRLSYIFIGSMCAAVGAGFLMYLLIDEPAAGQAIAIDVAIVNATMGFYLAILDRRQGYDLLLTILFFALWTCLFVGAGVWAFRQSFHDTVPMPGIIRWSFAVFVGFLLFASISLILTVDTIFPWPLKPESSVLFGYMFLGSAALFVPGIIRPWRNNARLQLFAFLAYDLVLIVPFLRHIPDVRSEHVLSLVIYLAVIVYSGAIAIYGLVFDPQVRVIGLIAHPSPQRPVRPA